MRPKRRALHSQVGAVVSLDRLRALLSTKTTTQEQLTEEILSAVRAYGVVRVSAPCSDKDTISYLTVLSRKIREANSTVILSEGRVWLNDVAHWTFEGYTPKVQEAIAKAKG